MEFEALDGIKLVMLMAAGLLFAVVGLYLLIRPKPEGSAAKIEIFGLKFESSSAGLLVFLIGAVFLVIPLFVPEKKIVAEVPIPSPGETLKPKLVDKPDPAKQPVPEQPTPTPVVIAGEKVEETEPNDSVETATPFALGQTLRGQTGSDGDVDWFVMPIPASGIQGHEVKLKHFNKNGNQVTAQVFNHREENVGYLNARKGAIYLPIKTDFEEELYFRVTGNDRYDSGYELTVLPDSSN